MINEPLLEMHYQSALVELFSAVFGKKFLRLLKPSSQNERWVGFDQGWIHTSLPMDQFYTELKNTVQAGQTTFDKLYLAYFFQFKLADCITRGSNRKPTHYSTPYYRCELSLQPNPTTGISQHETLLRLSQIPNTEVSYACGMLFNIDDIYEKPDLNKLRFVPLSSAPTGWTTNHKHSITFQTQIDPNPLWCSKPEEGISFTISQMIEQQKLRLLTVEELEQLFARTNSLLNELYSTNKYLGRLKRIESYYPESFTILEFGNNSG